jgi:hypothetical protein
MMSEVNYRAEKVAEFLGHPVIREVFASLAGAYFEQWKEAADPAAREHLWAKCRALDDLMIGMQAVVDAAEGTTTREE